MVNSKDIAYRVYDNETKQMYKVHTLHLGTNKAIISMKNGNKSISLDNCTLMQNVGLNDLNKISLYEDDIVETNYERGPQAKGQIKFGIDDKENLGFYILWKNHELRQDIFYWCMEDKIKVIGNIHENPGLIDE